MHRHNSSLQQVVHTLIISDVFKKFTMIFFKQIFILAAIVHLVACSDDVEANTTPSSIEETTVSDYNENTQPSESSASTASTVKITEISSRVLIR